MEKDINVRMMKSDQNPMKMDLIVLILDIFVYALITGTYIILLIRISVQVHKAVREKLYGERRRDWEDGDSNSSEDEIEVTVTTNSSVATTPDGQYLTRF